MSCKPESKNQRLERIAVQILAGMLANPALADPATKMVDTIDQSIRIAKHFIKQLDEQAEAD